MVRLLRQSPTYPTSLVLSFNPTMVRLLPRNLRSRAGRKSMFQSHNGAIAAGWAHYVDGDTSSFQSHNGAIAAANAGATQIVLQKFQSHNGAIAA